MDKPCVIQAVTETQGVTEPKARNMAISKAPREINEVNNDAQDNSTSLQIWQIQKSVAAMRSRAALLPEISKTVSFYDIDSGPYPIPKI